jgi:hypothetical protein
MPNQHNVTNLNDKGKNKTLKLSKGFIETNLMDFITIGKLMQGMVEGFHGDAKDKLPSIRVFRDSHDQYYILSVNKENNTCEKIYESDVRGGIGRFIKFHFAYENMPYSCYNIDSVSIKRLTRRLIEESSVWKIDDKPKLIGLANEDDLAWIRHDFGRIKNVTPEMMPRFTKLLETMKSNTTPMLQLLGAALANKPINRRAILLYGLPGTGKNTFVEIMKLVFGRKAFKKLDEHFETDKFSWHILEDSRLWFKDEVSSKYLNSDTFKAITGSRSYMLRKMQKESFEIEIKGNFIFTINTSKLQPSGEPAIWQDRIIGIEKQKDPDHKTALSPEDEAKTYADEIPYIYNYLIDLYEDSEGTLDEIDTSIFDDIVTESHDEMEVIFNRYFEKISDWENNKKYLNVTTYGFGHIWLEIQQDYNQFGRDKKNKLKLKKYIADLSGFNKGFTLPTNGDRFFPGIKFAGKYSHIAEMKRPTKK